MKAYFKKNGKIGFFDKDFALEALNSKRNILERISKVINFELFRPILEDAVLNKNKKNNSGAKPYDPVLLFKILILQRIYNLSDEATEVDINNAYDVAVDFAVLFTSFVGETTLSYKEGIWRMKKLKPEFKTTEELLNKFLEEYDR